MNVEFVKEYSKKYIAALDNLKHIFRNGFYFWYFRGVACMGSMGLARPINFWGKSIKIQHFNINRL